MKRLGLVLATVWLAAGAALAADKPAEARRAAVLEAVSNCRKIAEADARLKCFDEAAARLDEAEASGQVVVVDKEAARQVRKETFGLQLPSLDIFSFARGGKGVAPIAKGEDVNRIDATVKQASRGADGKWVIELDSGAVWRQIEPDEMVNGPHPGSKVVIRRASLGSFMMKVDNESAFKAHRDR